MNLIVVLVAYALCGYFITRGFIKYSQKHKFIECEGVYIDKLKALESRVAFLELKEYEIKDFVHYDDDNDFGWLTLAKSERDYGDKIRVGKNVLIKKTITQTNQKYYEYKNQKEKAFIDIRELG